MAISGFWHGAAWRFVIWGLLNAVGRVVTIPIDQRGWYKKIPKIIKQLVIFHFICLTWVFFRAANVGEAMLILKRFFSGLGGDPEIPVIIFALVGGVWGYQLLFNSRWRFILENRLVRIAGLVMAMLLFLVFATAGNKQFIYFQF